MADVNDKTISVLNDLIETCRDGETGFRTAAEGVNDPNLKALFNRYSGQRGEFSSELQALVTGLGGKPEKSGSVAGAVHRGWMDIKSAVTGKDVAAIISEAERGEDVAKATYQRALQEYMSPEIRAVIHRQYSAVLEAHDEVRRLEIQTRS
jgi:uncharacterized protein (TIGR02284 family)